MEQQQRQQHWPLFLRRARTTVRRPFFVQRLGYNSGFTEIPSNDYMFEAFTSSINGNPGHEKEERKQGHLVINEMSENEVNTKRGKASIGGGYAVTRQAKAQPVRRSQKLGDRVTALQQLVSPFGKQLLSSSYFDRNRNLQQGGGDNNEGDLRSRGLCLVPISSTASLTTPKSRAGELGDSLGPLGYGVLGELAGEDEADGGLDLPGSDGGLLVVPGELRTLLGELLEDVVDEAVHDAHGLARDPDVRVHLLQHLEYLDLEIFIEDKKHGNKLLKLYN
ncbi:hypothetical protein QJS10_CPA03g01551 [Acorus calamus]|uniref:Uncharacterized protein n=1 Tax=Acorus calamus TaxID=4465 RepID=A0AAV9F431_ACOCL|nr:hypothetical protein QJS10_CPA03g01551 [Acorus calamus]